jgi:hypothetical protein
MVQLQWTMMNLARTFSVRDIMVPEENLIRGRDKTDALRLLVEHPDFDNIPIPKTGAISQVQERGKGAPRDISPEDIVSDGTSVLDLVDVVAKRQFVFVLTGQSLGGFVHFSDLNNHLVKIPFFVLLEAVESKLAELIIPRVHEDVLSRTLNPSELHRSERSAKRLVAARANKDRTSALHFSQIVDIAIDTGKARLTKTERDAIVRVRNRVAHATDPLVRDFLDVGRLSEARRVCFRLLEPEVP